MRRITMWLLATVSAVVLLFSYRTSTMGAAAPDTTALADVSTSAPASASASAETTPTADPSTPSAAPPNPSSAAQTYTGTAANTRYGPVQVQITVVDGKITAATVTEVPDQNGRDREINEQAVPMLEQETVAAQSADIDMISGATYTCDGYVTSLQSAIDQAHLG